MMMDHPAHRADAPSSVADYFDPAKSGAISEGKCDAESLHDASRTCAGAAGHLSSRQGSLFGPRFQDYHRAAPAVSTASAPPPALPSAADPVTADPAAPSSGGGGAAAASVDMDVDSIACYICAKTEDSDRGPMRFLLCEAESCNRGAHLGCLKLRGLPRGTWLCDQCRGDPAAAASTATAAASAAAASAAAAANAAGAAGAAAGRGDVRDITDGLLRSLDGLANMDDTGMEEQAETLTLEIQALMLQLVGCFALEVLLPSRAECKAAKKVSELQTEKASDIVPPKKKAKKESAAAPLTPVELQGLQWRSFIKRVRVLIESLGLINTVNIFPAEGETTTAEPVRLVRALCAAAKCDATPLEAEWGSLLAKHELKNKATKGKHFGMASEHQRGDLAVVRYMLTVQDVDEGKRVTLVPETIITYAASDALAAPSAVDDRRARLLEIVVENPHLADGFAAIAAAQDDEHPPHLYVFPSDGQVTQRAAKQARILTIKLSALLKYAKSPADLRYKVRREDGDEVRKHLGLARAFDLSLASKVDAARWKLAKQQAASSEEAGVRATRGSSSADAQSPGQRAKANLDLVRQGVCNSYGKSRKRQAQILFRDFFRPHKDVLRQTFTSNTLAALEQQKQSEGFVGVSSKRPQGCKLLFDVPVACVVQTTAQEPTSEEALEKMVTELLDPYIGRCDGAQGSVEFRYYKTTSSISKENKVCARISKSPCAR